MQSIIKRYSWLIVMLLSLASACATIEASSLATKIASVDLTIATIADTAGLLLDQKRITVTEAQKIVHALKFALAELEAIETLSATDFSSASVRLNVLLLSVQNLQIYVNSLKSTPT